MIYLSYISLPDFTCLAQMSHYFAVELKTKDNFPTAAMLCYILRTCYRNKSCIFFDALLPYIILGSYIKWR
jgi:hypothetical protein